MYALLHSGMFRSVLAYRSHRLANDAFISAVTKHVAVRFVCKQEKKNYARTNSITTVYDQNCPYDRIHILSHKITKMHHIVYIAKLVHKLGPLCKKNQLIASLVIEIHFHCYMYQVILF